MEIVADASEGRSYSCDSLAPRKQYILTRLNCIMRFPFRIALYVFDLIQIIGPMGGWVGPEGNRWEFAPSGAAAAEPSIRGTSSWLPTAPVLAAGGKTHERTSTHGPRNFTLEGPIFKR